ncbi:SDR family NAD(P)-dependent oxidoreductase [Actinomadura verrucosospora]|uniref:Short-chain dehydrogenase/reductase SDR n=1 Tax=Actinomadura verrucosospora TaxID=46165 RepID=A0A7D3VW47_ACTVE|nr:SDR family NAD(P)-dependent oxidoreductase [Actinomadura verrucosospora]QKG25095.1 short-chain dehydrogenase/reductase SDR [Actinomadura verrucosospora]
MRRTALVAGAAHGVGALAARRLAAAAWDVVAVDTDEDGLAATALRSPNTHVRTCDITEAKDVADILGVTGAVHRLVIAPPPPATPEPPVDEVMRDAFLGPANLVRAALPGMLERAAGEVIVIVPAGTSPASAAAAAAARAYVEALADEHRGRGVAFRCASPPAGVPARLVVDELERSLARPGEVHVAPGPPTGPLPGPLRRVLFGPGTAGRPRRAERAALNVRGSA